MLFRIGVALTALSLVHGADKSASDIAAATDSVRRQVPAGVVGLCIDNAALCQSIALKAGGGLVGTGMADAISVPAPEHVVSLGQFPLPPRRPMAGVPERAEGLDRAGLIRAIRAGS